MVHMVTPVASAAAATAAAVSDVMLRRRHDHWKSTVQGGTQKHK